MAEGLAINKIVMIIIAIIVLLAVLMFLFKARITELIRGLPGPGEEEVREIEISEEELIAEGVLGKINIQVGNLVLCADAQFKDDVEIVRMGQCSSAEFKYFRKIKTKHICVKDSIYDKVRLYRGWHGKCLNKAGQEVLGFKEISAVSGFEPGTTSEGDRIRSGSWLSICVKNQGEIPLYFASDKCYDEDKQLLRFENTPIDATILAVDKKEIAGFGKTKLLSFYYDAAEFKRNKGLQSTSLYLDKQLTIKSKNKITASSHIQVVSESEKYAESYVEFADWPTQK